MNQGTSAQISDQQLLLIGTVHYHTMYNVTTLNLCYHLWLVEIELLSSETDSLVVTVAMTNC